MHGVVPGKGLDLPDQVRQLVFRQVFAGDRFDAFAQTDRGVDRERLLVLEEVLAVALLKEVHLLHGKRPAIQQHGQRFLAGQRLMGLLNQFDRPEQGRFSHGRVLRVRLDPVGGSCYFGFGIVHELPEIIAERKSGRLRLQFVHSGGIDRSLRAFGGRAPSMHREQGTEEQARAGIPTEAVTHGRPPFENLAIR
jgi:hypothetical protein